MISSRCTKEALCFRYPDYDLTYNGTVSSQSRSIFLQGCRNVSGKSPSKEHSDISPSPHVEEEPRTEV